MTVVIVWNKTLQLQVVCRKVYRCMCIRVALRLSDFRAHPTTYSTNHLKWFFTKKFFWEMIPQREIKIQSFRKQSSKKGHGMNGFQKFLCVVNRHEESDFLEFWTFLLRSFFGHFSRCHGSKKWPEQKKLFK